jgi:drug/metabolite transporter (DMT)-like permease
MGCAALVGGSYCAAQASILVKAKAGGIHPASLLFGQMVSGLPFIITYSLIVEGSPLHLHWSTLAVISVLYLTLLGTIAAFWLYYWLLRRIESTKAMMISLVTPLIAVLVGGVVLVERLPAQTFFGGLLIIASIGLIMIRARSGRISRKHPELELDLTTED